MQSQHELSYDSIRNLVKRDYDKNYMESNLEKHVFQQPTMDCFKMCSENEPIPNYPVCNPYNQHNHPNGNEE